MSKRTKVERFAPNEDDRLNAVDYWRKRDRNDLVASLGEQVEAFRDHHMAHGSLMADWHAAWRTWVRYAVKFNRKPLVQPRDFVDRTPNRYAGREAFRASEYDTPPRSNIRSIAEILASSRRK